MNGDTNDLQTPQTRRVRMVKGGPMLVEGPVDVECASGEVIRCDRFMVALCMCGRSRRKPFCDTSHRRGVDGRPRSR